VRPPQGPARRTNRLDAPSTAPRLQAHDVVSPITRPPFSTASVRPACSRVRRTRSTLVLLDSDTPDREELRCSFSRPASSAPERWAQRSPSWSPRPGSRSCCATSNSASSTSGSRRREQLTADRLDALVASGKLTREQADEQLERTLALIRRHDLARRLRRRRLRDRGGARAARAEARRVRRARRRDAGPRDPRLEHLGALDQRAGRRHDAPRAGARLPLLLPGSVMRLVEIVEGIETSPESIAGGELRGAGPQDRDPLRRRARLRRQPRADLGGQRAVARAGGGGPRHRRARRGGRRAGRRPDRALRAGRHARARHRAARRRAPARGLRRALPRPRRDARAGRQGRARRQERARLLRGRRAAHQRRRARRRRGASSASR
jgi:hypothetical protein